MTNKKMAFFDWALYVTVAAAALMWLFPLLWMVATSIRPEMSPVGTGSLLWGGAATFANFKRAWSTAPFATYYQNTFIIVVGVLAMQMVTITLGGYVFARLKFRGKDLLFILFLLQLMVPAEALVVPNFQTMKWIGIDNTRIAIMLPYVASAFGTFLMRQTFKQVPKDLEDAAVIDGCGHLQTLWYVFIPVARPTLAAFALTSISYHWNNFFWPLIITNSNDVRPLTVGLALFTKAAESGADWSLITAGTVMVVAPLLVAFFLFQRQFISSFMRSGIK
ncbi:MAG TPA: carbohydrate ABC transporter permease [Symbiobacteriaceae bacterium]|nr:carbohydrate ABC transporter permease [Symbiobacteriaceae bacterium]